VLEKQVFPMTSLNASNPLLPPASPSRKCLLLDDRFIADAAGIRRVVATGRKSGELMKFPAPAPWNNTYTYLSVIQDDETGEFHLFYSLVNTEATKRDTVARKAGKLAEFLAEKPAGINSHCAIAYARSKDGWKWETPLVGTGIFEGTNIVYAGTKGVHAAGVVQRLFPDDPARKFTAYDCDWQGAGQGGHSYAHSPDGIHWTLDPKSPFIFGESDSNNNILKNPFGEGYLIYGRPWDSAPWTWVPGNSRRRVAVTWGKDPYTWSDTRNMLYPDELDDFLYYGIGVFYRDGVLFGMLSKYQPVTETMDVELLFSRDGINWGRHPSRRPLFERGAEGDFDSVMVIPGCRPVEVGGDLRIYYGGSPRYHDDITPGMPGNCGIGCVTFPKNRLIGRRGDAKLGILLTHPFEIDGDHLYIDAQTNPAGTVVAALVEPDPHEPGGKAIPGFTREDCDVFKGDSARHELTWGGKNISSLKGRRVRLRIGLTMASLWSYEVAND